MPKSLSRLIGTLAITLVALSLLLGACGKQEEVTLKLATAGATPGTTTTGATTTAPGATTTTTPASSTAGDQPTATPALGGSSTASPARTTARASTAAATTAATAGTPAASPTPRYTVGSLKPVTGYPGKLSLIGPEETLYIYRFDGSTPQLLLGKAGVRPSKTQDGVLSRWPTWSRDGSKLAVIGINVKSGSVANSDVTVVGADGKNPFKVQDGSADQPIFLSWSPDGNLLSLLVSQGSQQLELRLLDTSKGLQGAAATLHKVAEGAAIYTGWSPDSQQLLIHSTTGSNSDTVSLLTARDSKAQAVPFKVTPGSFRTPAFSNDGSRLAFSVLNTSGNEEISLQDKGGQATGTLDAGGKGASFIWSPAGNKLAYTSQSTGMKGFYRGIYLADLDQAGNAKPTGTQIVNEPVAAFFWAPSGKKLAYIGVTDTQDLLIWKIYDLDTKTSTTLTNFYPSNTFIQLITYHDQYGQSNSIWSPDSKALVFSGYSKDDIDRLTGPNSDSEDDTPLIYLVPTEGAQAGKLNPLAPGQLAFWSK